jgi:hypothetical protein
MGLLKSNAYHFFFTRLFVLFFFFFLARNLQKGKGQNLEVRVPDGHDHSRLLHAVLLEHRRSSSIPVDK